jgi:hypothetical protein
MLQNPLRASADRFSETQLTNLRCLALTWRDCARPSQDRQRDRLVILVGEMPQTLGAGRLSGAVEGASGTAFSGAV